MKIHHRLLIGFLICLAIIVSGCGTPANNIYIAWPPNLSIIQMPPPSGFVSVNINATSSSRINLSDPIINITTTLEDNGALVRSFTDPSLAGISGIWGGTVLPWAPTTLGAHILSATVHVVDPAESANFTMTATARVCVVSSLSNLSRADYACLANAIIVFTSYADTVSQSQPASAPTPTTGVLILIPTATSTPASALDCPSGTYFADVTHQCIAISTPTPPKVGKSCNLSQAVCNTQKKKFNPATCSCQ